MRRISSETAAVLGLFLAKPEQARYGREILLEIGLKSGSLYPILHRLEERGLLEGFWEDLERAVEEGRRPRRLYRLSSRRIEQAEDILGNWQSAQRRELGSTIGSELPA